ncbi:5-oxoprolinase subunit B family protein [Naasia lichenicola]|uniref:5-oxoprolinase subunit B family protein n=1 Tax=Naasia lichenicola TaxID=2565933 RepID=UPI001E3B1437|nr:allophanate hydrolase subunit 1 [Naasia lichenicola]
MRILPFGDRAVLAEYDSLSATIGAYRALSASTPRGLVELVPAARTVLVRVDPQVLPLDAARRWLLSVRPGDELDGPLPTTVTIAVTYDGEDLDDAARLLGITVDELIARHTGTEWTCAFVGFAPGFAYLTSASDPLVVPRRSTSRPAVPAGSVGLAGEFTGVYPRESPGGWQLIGRTDAVLWDATKDFPARISPGDLVRFTAVDR